MKPLVGQSLPIVDCRLDVLLTVCRVTSGRWGNYMQLKSRRLVGAQIEVMIASSRAPGRSA